VAIVRVDATAVTPGAEAGGILDEMAATTSFLDPDFNAEA
jgi:hypothetical protein